MRPIDEQVEAKMMLVLWKLGIIKTYDELDRLVDELQVKLFERKGYTSRTTQPLTTDTATPGS